MSSSRGIWLRRDDITLGDIIGAGSFGEVFRARLNGETVAVKVVELTEVHARNHDGEIGELEIMQSLKHHPNIVQLRGAALGDGTAWIVMELASDGNMSDYPPLSRAPVDPRLLCAAYLQIALGLAYLHSRSPPVLHLDLKHNNVLVKNDGGTLVLTDFGLSRVLRNPNGVLSRTAKGHPDFAAPELHMNRGRQASPACDVYSFGRMLHMSSKNVVDKTSKLFVALRKLAEECAKLDPEDRPTTDAVVARLQALNVGNTVGLTPPASGTNASSLGENVSANVRMSLVTDYTPVDTNNNVAQQHALPVPIQAPSLPVPVDPQPPAPVEAAPAPPTMSAVAREWNPNICFLRSDEFTVRDEVLEENGSAQLRAGTMIGYGECVVSENYFFRDPMLSYLDGATFSCYVQREMTRLKSWAALAPHPNVKQLLGVWCREVTLTADPSRGIVLPDVPVYAFTSREATTLGNWLKLFARLLTDEELVSKITSIAIQVMRGLAHSHSFGIVHCDLKCSNIYCDENATQIRVGGFDCIATNAYVPKVGEIQGNAYHMAPELFARDPRGNLVTTVSVKADVWSMAMMMLEMLAISRDLDLRQIVFDQFTERLVVDQNGDADPVKTAQKQEVMQQLFNGELQRYPPCVRHLFGMAKQQGRPTFMEAALQLDWRRRESMAHCVLLMEVAQNASERNLAREM